MKRLQIGFLLLFFTTLLGFGQRFPIDYSFSEKYSDRYKYSNLLAINDDGKGGTILVRTYFAGLILKPKGYFIEHYNSNQELIAEYNYKLKQKDFIEAVVKNGQLYLLFLEYNYTNFSYNYVVHQSPIDEFNFTKRTILSISSKEVMGALDKNYYNRNFSSGFTTSVLFNQEKSAFVISTHFKKGKNNKFFIYLFDTSFQKRLTQDFSEEVEEKNYAFEEVAISKNLDEVYLIGKAYFRRKRFEVNERKFQYELVKINAQGAKTQTFDDSGRYSEALKPVLVGDELLCVGFYANRKDNRYNGLSYFNLNKNSLAFNQQKYHPFSVQFMNDKFGREEDKEVKNLVFKNLSISDDKSILFNAEEYFVTSGYQDNPSGARVKVSRYHYNDMVSAKLDADGNLDWVRNINKSEVTQGDGAYASYSSIMKGEDTYFFISTASENPQQLSKERIVFKQGFGRNRNVFVIRLDTHGEMSYEKVIDGKEARLPLMVSTPLLGENTVHFYAKRGSKKQLVKVTVN